YVLITASLSYLPSICLRACITPFQRAAKVPQFHAFASAETTAAASLPSKKPALCLFNCAQRAHYNSHENYTIVLTGMVISGLRYPRVAAVAGMV
ncbi:hypothetical protein BU25DRAFT_337923, partial [Macroventuria anomochaeta]